MFRIRIIGIGICIFVLTAVIPNDMTASDWPRLYDTRLVFSTGIQPGQVWIANLNSDSIKDFLILPFFGGNISVMLGKPDGSLALPVSIDGGDASDVAIADMDGDSDSDIVISCSRNGSIGVLSNDGNGVFSNPVHYPVGGSPERLDLFDIDGDSDSDVVVCSGGYLSVLLNDGHGVLGISRDYNYSPDSLPDPVCLDLDGDMDIDVAVGDRGGVHVFLNTNGELASPAKYPVPIDLIAIAAANLDSDLDCDLILLNSNPGGIAVLLNQGEGTFSDPVLYSTNKSHYSFGLADLDGDKDIDVALADSCSPYPGCGVTTLLNNGSATFSPGDQFFTGSEYQHLAVCDLDNDEDADIAVTSEHAGTLSLLFNNGAGLLSAPGSLPSGTSPWCVAVGDLTGDQKVDLVVGNFGSDNVSVYAGDGGGNFGYLGQYAASREPLDVAIADLDGDGDQDLLVSSFHGSNLSILLNNGYGVFTAMSLLDCGSSVVKIAVADIDGDRDLDIVAGCSTRVAVLFNKGNATFEKPVDYLKNGTECHVALGDLNNDGSLDLVASTGSDHSVQVHMNDGRGAFLPSQPVIVTEYGIPTYVALVDLNGDARLDIVAARNTAHQGDAEESLFTAINNGDGSFPTPSYPLSASYPIGADVRSIQVGDADHDGDMDVFVSRESRNDVALLINDGHGALQIGKSYGVGNAPIGIAVADFNRDNLADVAVANSISNTVSVLVNINEGPIKPSESNWFLVY